MIVDFFDLNLLRLLGQNDFSSYQILDKSLDTYYLTLEVYTSSFWVNELARRTSLILYVYRLTGVILFFIFQMPVLLVIFANVFETFFLFYLGFQKVFKRDLMVSSRVLITVLFLLGVLKVLHEYSVHVNPLLPGIL